MVHSTLGWIIRLTTSVQKNDISSITKSVYYQKVSHLNIKITGK